MTNFPAGSGPATNTGHGHVWPRPDGVKARCGGPAICRECAVDQARFLVPSITDRNPLIKGTCVACRHSRPTRPDVVDRTGAGAKPMRLWCAAMMPDQTGENRGLAAPTFDRRVPDDYGCTFWQPAYTGTEASPQGDGHH